jgi:hypothetical protein
MELRAGPMSEVSHSNPGGAAAYLSARRGDGGNGGERCGDSAILYLEHATTTHGPSSPTPS